MKLLSSQRYELRTNEVSKSYFVDGSDQYLLFVRFSIFMLNCLEWTLIQMGRVLMMWHETYINLDSAPMGSAPASRAISGFIFPLSCTPFIRLKYISSLSGAQIYYLKYIISNISAQMYHQKYIGSNISSEAYGLKCQLSEQTLL